jgi:hypothetical protein
MLNVPNSLFASYFPGKILTEFPHLPIHASCPIHASLLDFITVKVFDEAFKL